MVVNNQIPHRDRPKPSESDAESTSRNGQNRPSSWHFPSHEPEIYDIEDLPVNGPKLDSSAQLVKPYAIEEPDEDTASGPNSDPNTSQRRQPRSSDDLIASMEELYCDSDHSNPGLMPTKRGRKRKPAITCNMTDDFSSTQSSSTASVVDAQYERPSLSPKRPRKKDELTTDLPANFRAARFRRRRARSGSSTASISTETSDANAANVSFVPDTMDLD